MMLFILFYKILVDQFDTDTILWFELETYKTYLNKGPFIPPPFNGKLPSYFKPNHTHYTAKFILI